MGGTVMPSVSLNGAELYYEDRGSGSRALFVHGMCGDANVWDGQVDRLANWLRCVTYDRRGPRRSSLGDIQQRTGEMHADDAAALIQALELMRCLLVGSSSGARSRSTLCGAIPSYSRARCSPNR